MLERYAPHYRQLLKLALPLVLTQAGQITMQLIDSAMVGRFGTAELAAASFATNIYFVVMLLGLGVFMGITPLAGRARGARDDSKTAVIIKSGFALSLVLIPLITLLSWSFSWIMPHMGQTSDVVRLAIPYYRTLVISLVPFLLFSLLKQTGEGLGNTMAAMVVTLICNLLKVVLNYALIFGNMGSPQLGLLGAGYATIVSRAVMPLLLYAGLIYIKPVRRYFDLMRTVRATYDEIVRILKIGFPIAVQLVLEVSAFSFSAVMMGWMGNVPLASHEIAIGLASLTFMVSNGVAMAATIRVSYELGTRDSESMERAAYSALHMVLVYMGLCSMGFMLLRHQLPRLFTADPEVIRLTASLLVIAALFQMFDGLQTTCVGILRGLADVKAPMFISVLSYIFIGLSASYICAFLLKFGPLGIWYGFMAGLVFAGSLLSLRISRRIRR